MKKLLLSLSILCLFSSLSWSAETNVEADQQKTDREFNFPDYSPLGQRIANGEAISADVFYWIKADGTIGSTKRGWRRVPKSSRHLVYLDRNKAEQAVQDASKSPEERAQIEKQRSKEEMRSIEAAKNFAVTSSYAPYRSKHGGKDWACVMLGYEERRRYNFPDGVSACVGQYKVARDYRSSTGSTTYTRSTGDRYVGEFNNVGYDGEYHGQGTYTWVGGDQYVGESRRGNRHGQGTYTWASGNKYVGDWRKGQRYGNGTYIWASGNKYVGQWRYGQRHGHGTTTYADGTIEEGFWAYDDLTAFTGPACPGSYSAFSWHNCVGWRPLDSRNGHIGWYQNGQAHGEGISMYNQGKKDERHYTGNFKNGEAHGQGIYIWASGQYKGDQYKGGIREGKKHGQGTFKWANGRKYVGEFKDNNRHGQGTQTWGKGNKYVGQWKNGLANGQGTETYTDGRKYVGEFKDNKIQLGTLTWLNGQKYTGEFKDYKSHGIGNFYRTDGSMMGGMWKNEEPVEGYSGYKCSGDSVLWSDCIGTLTLADGTQFIGKFLDGKTSGKGTLIFPDSRPMQFAVEPKEQEQIVSSSSNELGAGMVSVGPTIGDTVKTKYFDVTVNEVELTDYLGYEYLIEAGPGNTFLVIDVTYQNTSSEARILGSGEVMVRMGDKELRYDTAEVVFEDGYILFDSLNPMVTRTGKVVFKIPQGLEGEIFYKPARSTELIKLN